MREKNVCSCSLKTCRYSHELSRKNKKHFQNDQACDPRGGQIETLISAFNVIPTLGLIFYNKVYE
jgi:hypothetical protein